MGRAWPILLLLGFCQFCATWGSLAIVAVQVEMRSGLGVSAAGIAALVWAFSFSIAIGAPLAQSVIGHWSRRFVLVVSLVLMGTAAFGLGLSQTWGQAMVARVLMAVGAASIMPTASVIAATLVTEDQRPAALSFVFGGLTVALVIALPISSAVGEAFGWRMAWFVAGGAALTAALGVLIGVPGHVRGVKASLTALLAVLANPATALTIATTALLICGGFLTYSMIAFWFVEVGGAPRSALTPALLVAGIASAFGNASSAPIVRFFGKEGTILFCLAFTAVCFAILWAVPHIYWLSYPTFVCFGVGWSMCLAPIQARLVETAGKHAQLALALNTSAFFGGQGLGALVGGMVYISFGPSALPLASLAILMLTTGVFAAATKTS